MSDYVTLAEFKVWLRMNADDDTQDLALTLALDSAEDAVNQHCDAVFEDPIPAPVRLAVLIQASRYKERQDSPWGVMGSPEMGNEMRLLAELDPDVKQMLRSVRNYWWAVGVSEESA